MIKFVSRVFARDFLLERGKEAASPIALLGHAAQSRSNIVTSVWQGMHQSSLTCAATCRNGWLAKFSESHLGATYDPSNEAAEVLFWSLS